MNNKLSALSQLHKKYILEQENIMHSINVLLNILDTEPKIYSKLDDEISKLSILHAKMTEIESFILQFRASELKNKTEIKTKNEERDK